MLRDIEPVHRALSHRSVLRITGDDFGCQPPALHRRRQLFCAAPALARQGMEATMMRTFFHEHAETARARRGLAQERLRRLRPGLHPLAALGLR